MAKDATMEMATGAIDDGACFFLTKPIPDRALANIWQHTFRKKNGTRLIIENSMEDGSHSSGNSNKGNGKIGNENENKNKLKRKLEDREEKRSEDDESDDEEGDEDDDKDERRRNRRSRMRWSDELHAKFLEAIEKLRAQSKVTVCLLI